MIKQDSEKPGESRVNVKDQYVRLASTPTINSFLRKKRIEDRLSCTVDSLDLALSACYDHHNQWWATRSQIVMQKSFNSPCPHVRQEQFHLTSNSEKHTNPAVISSEPYRNDIHHAHIGLTSSSHTSSTHRGYGRGPDGVFFTS